MVFTVASDQGLFFTLPISFSSSNPPTSLASDTGSAVTTMAIYADKTTARLWGRNVNGYVNNHKAFWVSIGV